MSASETNCYDFRSSPNGGFFVEGKSDDGK